MHQSASFLSSSLREVGKAYPSLWTAWFFSFDASFLLRVKMMKGTVHKRRQKYSLAFVSSSDTELSNSISVRWAICGGKLSLVVDGIKCPATRKASRGLRCPRCRAMIDRLSSFFSGRGWLLLIRECRTLFPRTVVSSFHTPQSDFQRASTTTGAGPT